jgi:N-acetylglucosamine malate deacetylase 1
MNILAITAHPDDAEILVSGTLAKYQRAGHSVAICIVADGAAGSMVHTPEESRAIRREEAKNAATAINADMYWIGEPDANVFDTEASRLKVLDVVRIVKPQVVFTHADNDYHADHRATSAIAFAASFNAALPNIANEHPAVKDIPALFHMEPLGGYGFEPELFVDISNEIELKRKALACHVSQLQWLKDLDNVDVNDMMEINGRYRGYQAGCRYAECFRQVQMYGRAPAGHLLP